MQLPEAAGVSLLRRHWCVFDIRLYCAAEMQYNKTRSPLAVGVHVLINPRRVFDLMVMMLVLNKSEESEWDLNGCVILQLVFECRPK